MKELYTKPVSDAEEFKTVDVITTSDPNGGTEQMEGEGW